MWDGFSGKCVDGKSEEVNVYSYECDVFDTIVAKPMASLERLYPIRDKAMTYKFAA